MITSSLMCDVFKEKKTKTNIILKIFNFFLEMHRLNLLKIFKIAKNSGKQKI